MNVNGELPYQRVLLKLSGEALAGHSGTGIDPVKVAYIAQRVREVFELDMQVAIVIGGGNLWRGEPAAKLGMDRSTADHMGMIATVMNGLALQDAIERLGIGTRVQTAVEMNSIAEPYIRLRAIRHMEKGPHRRHRQSLFHHRFRRRPARQRDSCRCNRQGD